MGLFSGLFSSGPKQLTQSQTTESTPWAPLSPYLQGLYSKASSMAPQQYYGGNLVAGFTPTQERGLEGMVAAGDRFGGAIQNPAEAGWRSLLNAADINNNPAVQGLLDRNNRQVTQALTEQWLPKINQGAIAYGDYGGSGHGKAQQIALEGASEQLANANAGVLSDAYGQGLQASQYALGQTPMVGQLGFMAPQVQADVGAMQQGQLQSGIDAELQRHLFNQAAPWEALAAQNQAYSSGLGFGTTSGTSTQTNPNRRQPFMDLVGVGLGAASLFGGK